MSRPMMSVSVLLADGKTVIGQGRDLLATAARAYRQATGSSAEGARLELVEHLKHGHAKSGERRFEGTFHMLVTGADGTRQTLEIQGRPQ